jgi:tetratricopeptide (TPR) repeat protein
VGYLEKAIQADSTFYDAYLGVGNYKYWAGRFTKYLRWLPWIRDERTLGISMVQRSIERGKLSHWVGISSLGWIEYDRKHFDAGLELFLSGLREFPGSRFFLWGAADCAFGMRDFRLASQYYSQLLESIQRAPGQSGYNEAECRTKLMKSFEALREREGALTQAEAILAMKPVPAVESRIGRHRRAAIECRRRLLEHGEKDK